jgi:CelD/BcsL family acetyltransferase involved in cellulose biosynthesis
MNKLSPGAVLLGWVIEEAVAEGMAEVDFLRQREAYKYLWGARDRINYKVYVDKSAPAR